MADSAVDGGLDGVSAGVGDTGEAEVAGEGVDHVLPLVVRALPHHGAERLPQFVKAVVGHRAGPGPHQARSIGFDDAAADGGSQVAPQCLLDLWTEPLVAEDHRYRLHQFVPLQRTPASGRLAERRHDVVGVEFVDRRRAARRLGIFLPVGPRCGSLRSGFSGGCLFLVCVVVGRLWLVIVVAEERRSFRGGRGLAASTARRLLGLLLLVEALPDLLGVAFVVEFQQALEDFTAGGFANCEAEAILGFVEVMAEVEVGPAIGGGDRLIHLDV